VRFANKNVFCKLKKRSSLQYVNSEVVGLAILGYFRTNVRKKIVCNIGFKENRQFFRRKLVKIEEN
jgi:hypothetical protein